MSLFSLLNSKSKAKLLSLELNPPRGVDLGPALARLETLPKLDFFNVTDCALAKLRLSGFAFASLIKQKLKIEPLVNLSCRDRNSIALQSDLLGAWALGVKSVVALTGDAVTVGDSPDAKGVFEVNSLGLLKIIQQLNSGYDRSGAKLTGATQFVSGCVVNPNARNIEAEIRRLIRKKESGATYALSQPVFDTEVAKIFFEKSSNLGIEILAGLMPVKNASGVQGLQKVPGIRLPDKLLADLNQADDKEIENRSVETALQVAESCKSFVTGFHVVSGGAPRLAVELCRRLQDLL